MSDTSDKIKERVGYVSVSAKDYRDGGEWDILISDAKINAARHRGMQLASELALIVPFVLAHPTAIFTGIRRDADEEKESDIPAWGCYAGLPECRFDANGKNLEPYEEMVYLVFVNADRVVYHYRWEKCCPDNPRLPMGHQTRFRTRVL